MKKFGTTFILLAAVLCVPNALALVSEFTLPSNPSITVTVESTVTQTNDEYLYTYQIQDVSDLNISLLSIPILTPLAIETEIYDFSDGGSGVFYWGAIDNPVIAAQAFFAPFPLTGGSSAILSFKSSYDAHEVLGYVHDAQLGSLTGNLLAPVPEPITLSLFAMGSGIIFRRKYKRN